MATTKHVARAAALVRHLMQTHAAIGAADMVIAYLPYQFIVDALVRLCRRILRGVDTLAKRV